MIPYFALLLIPLCIQFLLKVSHTQIRISKRGNIIDANGTVLPTFFFILFLLMVLRSDSVGIDLSNYKAIFNAIGNGRLLQSWYGVSEPVFLLYSWMVFHCISTDFQIFIAITATITVIPIAYIYIRDKTYGYMKAAIFVNMSTFIMLFSGIRQALAMSVGLLAYQALKENKTMRFFAWSLIVTGIHHTGFLTFLFYPLYKMRNQKRDLIWMVPTIAFIIVFNRPIFNLLSAFLGTYSDSYGTTAGSTGAFGSFLLFTLFTIFCYVIEDENKMDAEAFALRNILTFATVIQSFASLNPLAMRMNYYFILLIPYAIGKAIQCAKHKYMQVAKAGEIVIAVYFTYIFFSGTYHSYVTGISALDTVPYIPFWKG